MKSEHWVVCECGSLEHFMQISYEPQLDDCVFVTIHLSELPFWKRVKLAFLYVLGRKSKYGNFEEIILNKKQLKKVIDVMKDNYQHMVKSEQDINF